MDNKFAPKWNEPYKIKEVLDNRAYKFETLDQGSFLALGT